MKTITLFSTVTLAAILIVCTPASGLDFGKALGKLGIPDPVLDQLGGLMYATKKKTCTLCDREADFKMVKAAWARLLKAAPDSQPYKSAKAKNWQWEMVLVEDIAKADAESFPGGKVIVYSGASALAEKPAHMAFLLGHEMAHALARHAKARFDKHTNTLVMSAVTGGALNATKVDPKVTVAAMTAMGVAYEGAAVKPFTKEQETEADRNALILMAQAGYHPQEAVNYLKKFLTTPSGIKHSFQEDHPPVQERIAELEAHMQMALAIYRQTKG